jgi:regulator of replication initiation timing
MEWQQRNTVGKERLEELVSLYRALGFEVKVELYNKKEQAGAECDDCLNFNQGEYYTIYTGKKSEETI